MILLVPAHALPFYLLGGGSCFPCCPDGVEDVLVLGALPVGPEGDEGFIEHLVVVEEAAGVA